MEFSQSKPLLGSGQKPILWPRYLIFFLLGAILASIAFGIALYVYIEENPNTPNNNNNGEDIWKNVPQFGREFRDRFFYIDPKDIVINHGSFGAIPKPVQERIDYYQRQAQLNTQNWFGYFAKQLASDVRGKLADYIVANKSNVVLVENASDGVNAVIRSINFKQNDTVLQLSIAYGMVKESIKFAQNRWGFNVLDVVVPFPTDEAKILALVEDTLNNHTITFAVFDHIASAPAITLPLKQIIAMTRQRGILTLIDGAHAIGQLPLNMTDLDPDFYLSNTHKWMYAGLGSAFLYVRSELQHLIHPNIISFGYLKGFEQEFEWVGTRDFSSWLSISDALEFRKNLTEEKIYSWNNELCRKAGEMLVNEWNSSTPFPFSMMHALVTVRVPCSVNETTAKNGNNTVCYDWPVGSFNAYLMSLEHKIWVPFFEIEGVRYVRISCQIYNQFEDYVALKDAYFSFVKENNLQIIHI